MLIATFNFLFFPFLYMTIKATPKLVTYEERKKFGIFYTPPKVTQILTNWGVRDSKDTIFEPSFGGCGFLEASCERLEALGSNQPINQIYGCDIDENAFNSYLYPIYLEKDSSINCRFIKENFLSLTPEDFKQVGFSSIIGNPPYISYHKMSEDQRKSAIEVTKNLKIKLDKRASLWAYFVLHSLSFLNKEGRLAFVLPGSFLQSNYSEVLRDKISSSFEHSLIIQIGERLFSSEGTDESTSILLAEGFGKTTGGTTKIEFVSKIKDLENKIQKWKKIQVEKTSTHSKSSYILASKSSIKTFEGIQKKVSFIELGDIANISIGIVTGANDFFIIDDNTARKWEIPSDFLSPIFSKFRMTSGVEFTIDDSNKKIAENFRCFFVDTKGKKRIRNKKLKAYLDSFSKKEKLKNVTFAKRPIWHSPLYMELPDAFFPYMHNSGPRIILNGARTLCTNTIHRVFFKDKNGKSLLNKDKKLVAISILSSFSQFSAELEGRTYGSGALKIEPSEAKRIKLIFPEDLSEELINIEFDAVDNLFRENFNKQPDSATNELVRKRVDDFFINVYKNLEIKYAFQILSSNLETIRKRRKYW